MSSPLSNAQKLLRVAALVDLPRTAQSGGHVKCWERLAYAVEDCRLPLDLTVYFSGDDGGEAVGRHVRFRYLPPVFSSARLKFLPYMPDSADLAAWHPALARELPQYDVIHTTDGYFAFARTAAKVARRLGIPLVTSFHTDTPAYTRIFTRQTIEKLVGRWPWAKRALLETLRIPERQEGEMVRKLEKHVSACRYALVTRPEDQIVAERILGAERVKPLRLGINKQMFGIHRADRSGVLRDCGIAPDGFVILFVGRVDVGKNIHTLIEAVERILARGVPAHVIVAGVGPAEDDIRKRLGRHATLMGFVEPKDLARLYASVDVLALTSEVEIRSMVGGEALVSGCPVMVSEKSGIAPLHHNTPAMQVVSGGGESWARALEDFANDQAKRDRMRQDALMYSERFLASWQNVVTEDLFPVWSEATRQARMEANRDVR